MKYRHSVSPNHPILSPSLIPLCRIASRWSGAVGNCALLRVLERPVFSGANEPRTSPWEAASLRRSKFFPRLPTDEAIACLSPSASPAIFWPYVQFFSGAIYSLLTARAGQWRRCGKSNNHGTIKRGRKESQRSAVRSAVRSAAFLEMDSRSMALSQTQRSRLRVCH